MKRWQKIAAICALGLAGVCFLFFLVGLGSSPGQGEVSVILYGAFLMLSLVAVAVCAGLAMWLAFWHVKWVRYGGLILIGAAALYMIVASVTETLRVNRTIAEHERQFALSQSAEDEHYEMLRGLTGDRDAALAVLPAYMERMNAPDLHNGGYNNTWDNFGWVFTIYADVFFDHIREDAVYEYQFAPYLGFYCSNFDYHYGRLIVTSEQRERANIACPSHY